MSKSNTELVGLHSTKRLPGEDKRAWAKRIARGFFKGLEDLERKNGSLRQPRPGDRKKD